MDLSRSLLKDFAKMSNDPSKKPPSFTYVRGTVQTVGNKKYVRLDGSEGLTPISEVVDVENDDRVLVTIENHRATILGNFTFPPSARKENEALDKADNANNNANNAVNKAEQAEQKADNAIANAGTASSLAEESKKKAEEAFVAADNANKNLEETKNLANNALAQSNTAIDKAAQAQSNVAEAQNEINKIDNVVQGVKGDINSALTELNNLAGETTAIKQTMELEYTKKTELSTVETALRSEISQSAGEIKTEISQTYASKSYVDSIKNGSTNLAIGTSSKWSEWIVPKASSSNITHLAAVAHLPSDQKPGDKYTSQIEIEFLGVKNGTAPDTFRFVGYGICRENEDSINKDSLEVVWGQNLFDLNTPPRDGVHKFTHTYSITENTNKYHIIDLGFRADNWDGIGKYRYRCIKVEKGDKAGDWTPAPSEMATSDALVEIEGKLQSQITQNASGLSSTVSKMEKLESDTTEAQKLVSEALSNAFDAQAAAEQAQRNAAEAQKKADEATANSNIATEKAAEAQKLADDARQKVEIADKQLADSRAALQEAKQNLDNIIASGGTPEEIAAAQQKVDAATKAVEQALTDVAEAEYTAKKAQEAADKAKENANEAQLIAADATKKAANSKIVADKALESAELAAQRVAELTKRIDNAETAIKQNSENIQLAASKITELGDDLKNNYYNKTETNAQIDITADSITQEVSKTYTTKKEFNELEVGGRNYIHHGRGNLKAGFFESFDQVTDDYSECTLTSNGTYATVDLSKGFVLGCRDYDVGRQIVFSYDIMYTKWDFPEGTDRKYFWMGQRYTRALDSSITDGQYTKVTNHVLPEVGMNGCELHKWFHVEEVLTIPNQAAVGIEEEAKIVFHNSNASVSASVTFRLKNVKIEYGNKGSDWSPSPEDMEDSMAEMESIIQESVTQQGTSIQSTCENIILEALKSYTKTQDLESFKETISAQLKLLSDQMTLQFNQTTQEIVDINGELQEKFNTITKYFTFNIDGLTIGQVDSPYKVIINNDRYSMTVNDTEVMWIANGKVYTPEIEVTRGLKMFGYSIDQDQNGNINMEYVGG